MVYNNKYILENNFIHPFPQIGIASIRLSNGMGRKKETFNIFKRYFHNMIYHQIIQLIPIHWQEL